MPASIVRLMVAAASAATPSSPASPGVTTAMLGAPGRSSNGAVRASAWDSSENSASESVLSTPDPESAIVQERPPAGNSKPML